ncbi:MAG TPA: hypothetical protein PLW35_08685, partial [Verrucomicrobiota bacterium]|nr:hypothetical protein [Verrucomicrobiota bacterium]
EQIMKTGRLVLLAIPLTLPFAAHAQPIVTYFTTSVYAVLRDPVRLSFAPDGTLYAGRDASGSGDGLWRGDKGASYRSGQLAGHRIWQRRRHTAEWQLRDAQDRFASG